MEDWQERLWSATSGFVTFLHKVPIISGTVSVLFRLNAWNVRGTAAWSLYDKAKVQGLRSGRSCWMQIRLTERNKAIRMHTSMHAWTQLCQSFTLSGTHLCRFKAKACFSKKKKKKGFSLLSFCYVLFSGTIFFFTSRWDCRWNHDVTLFLQGVNMSHGERLRGTVEVRLSTHTVDTHNGRNICWKNKAMSVLYINIYLS